MISVLVLCTGNSARSILTEACLNDPRIGQGRFKAYSAGSKPTGRVNPFAEALLQDKGYDTSAMKSESWDAYSGDGAPALDLVITVCDSAANESCPLFPGKALKAHWGQSDPAAVEGSDEAIAEAFAEAYEIAKARVERLATNIEQIMQLAHEEQRSAIEMIGRDGLESIRA